METDSDTALSIPVEAVTVVVEHAEMAVDDAGVVFGMLAVVDDSAAAVAAATVVAPAAVQHADAIVVSVHRCAEKDIHAVV